MISFEVIQLEFRDLTKDELGRWIDLAFVRAEGPPGEWRFQEIDVARIRLILELRHTLEIEEQSLPVILSLVDQLYDMRRRIGRLNEALADLPPEVRTALVAKLVQ
jgi:chaperone modulatory protein CbpM